MDSAFSLTFKVELRDITSNNSITILIVVLLTMLLLPNTLILIAFHIPDQRGQI